MKEWLNGLEQNERRMVIAGSVLFVLMVVYVMVWEPIVNSVNDLRVSTAEQQTLLTWMKQAAQEVKQLRGTTGSSKKSSSGQSLLSLVDSTAKAGRLGNSLKRVQPDGENKVRVWLEEASFDDVVRWLEKLETHQGVRIVSSVFQIKEVAGRVDVRLVFAAAS